MKKVYIILKTTAGEYTLVVSAIGYQTVEKKVKLAKGRKNKSKRHYRAGGKELGGCWSRHPESVV